MKYSVARFSFSFAEPWQEEVFTQSLCDLGFDTLDGSDAYIPTDVLDAHRADIEQFIADTEGVTLLSFDECPDENWNATWEAEHPMEELPLGVKIIPHCAFGAGHHETTGMMISALLQTDLTGKSILDNGCGTGVLGIFAALRGATHVLAVDIDDKSVLNTQENATLNGVQIETRLGDTPPAGHYDLIMANIHRNILLSQMSLYARYLNPGGQLWLSGFYADDCPALTAAAENVGLTHTATRTDGDWCMLEFQYVYAK